MTTTPRLPSLEPSIEKETPYQGKTCQMIPSKVSSLNYSSFEKSLFGGFRIDIVLPNFLHFVVMTNKVDICLYVASFLDGRVYFSGRNLSSSFVPVLYCNTYFKILAKKSYIYSSGSIIVVEYQLLPHVHSKFGIVEEDFKFL